MLEMLEKLTNCLQLYFYSMLKMVEPELNQCRLIICDNHIIPIFVPDRAHPIGGCGPLALPTSRAP